MMERESGSCPMPDRVAIGVRSGCGEVCAIAGSDSGEEVPSRGLEWLRCRALGAGFTPKSEVLTAFDSHLFSLCLLGRV